MINNVVQFPRILDFCDFHLVGDLAKFIPKCLFGSLSIRAVSLRHLLIRIIYVFEACNRLQDFIDLSGF